MITVGELKVLLADIPDYAWVCLKDGPLELITEELGASEPFVLLERKSCCPHGASTGEPCGACDSVRADILG